MVQKCIYFVEIRHGDNWYWSSSGETLSASFIYSFSRQSLSSAIRQVSCLPSLLAFYLGRHSSSWMRMCTHTSSRRTQLISQKRIPKFATYLSPQRFHIHPRFNSVLDYSMWVTKVSWRAKDSLQVEETQRLATTTTKKLKVVKCAEEEMGHAKTNMELVYKISHNFA